MSGILIGIMSMYIFFQRYGVVSVATPLLPELELEGDTIINSTDEEIALWARMAYLGNVYPVCMQPFSTNLSSRLSGWRMDQLAGFGDRRDVLRSHLPQEYRKRALTFIIGDDETRVMRQKVELIELVCSPTNLVDEFENNVDIVEGMEVDADMQP